MSDQSRPRSELAMAQWVERQSHKLKVRGSTPSWREFYSGGGLMESRLLRVEIEVRPLAAASFLFGRRHLFHSHVMHLALAQGCTGNGSLLDPWCVFRQLGVFPDAGDESHSIPELLAGTVDGSVDAIPVGPAEVLIRYLAVVPHAQIIEYGVQHGLHALGRAKGKPLSEHQPQGIELARTAGQNESNILVPWDEWVALRWSQRKIGKAIVKITWVAWRGRFLHWHRQGTKMD